MIIVGNIQSIDGLIVNIITTIVEKPPINSILFMDEFPEVLLRVISYEDKYIAKCINLTGSHELYKGAKIITENKGLNIPVGEEIIGHVFDSLGRSIDSEDN